MSVLGILSSSFLNYSPQNVQNTMQQSQQEFQQLGQDLQAGNLSAAQADFATLAQLNPQVNATSSSQNASPIAQEFSQLSQDLQSGNLSAAQQDYATLQQDFQSQGAQPHHHHHHHGGSSSSQSNGISQLLQQLGQDLQSGNLTTAQQTYSTLQQDFQQFTQNGLPSPLAPSQTSAPAVSVST